LDVRWLSWILVWKVAGCAHRGASGNGSSPPWQPRKRAVTSQRRSRCGIAPFRRLRSLDATADRI